MKWIEHAMTLSFSHRLSNKPQYASEIGLLEGLVIYNHLLPKYS